MIQEMNPESLIIAQVDSFHRFGVNEGRDSTHINNINTKLKHKR